MSAAMIVGEKYWEKSRFDKAEKQYYEMLSQEKMYFKSEGLHRKVDSKHIIYNCKILTKVNSGCIRSNKYDTCDKFYKSKKNCKQLTALGHQKESSQSKQSLLVSEIAKAREHIKNSLEKMDTISCEEASALPSNILERFHSLEHENTELEKRISNLQDLCVESQKRISALEVQIKSHGAVVQNVVDDDDGVDLFASESEEESAEASRIREERLAAYAAKKSKKPLLIAKSSLVLDVKPWDDETDLKEMEAAIRKISIDGLLWGASKFVPVAFGISKLSISCVVEDDKVSIDWLTEEIEKYEKFVQSVDVAAFNKI